MENQPNAAEPAGVVINDYRWGTSAPITLGDGAVMVMGSASFSVTNQALIENGAFNDQTDAYVLKTLTDTLAEVTQTGVSAMDLTVDSDSIAEKLVEAVNAKFQPYGIVATKVAIQNVMPA